MSTSKVKQGPPSVCAHAERLEPCRPLRPRRIMGPHTRAALLAVAISAVQVLPGLVGPGGVVLALDGTWGRTSTGGNWSLATNWISNNVANGSGFTADFSFLNLTADNTVTLDSARTIGNLTFGDTTPGNNWTLTNGGTAANTLTLDRTTFLPKVNVVNGTATIGVRLLGSKGINKEGAGTLVLTNASNAYTNLTLVSEGTLAVGASGAVLPLGADVIVSSGATFNYGNGQTINNTGAAIGLLRLDNGTFRVSAGTGDFNLNYLLINSNGGTLNFAGTSQFYTHFTGSGAGIEVNANSTWIGAASTQIRNDTSALLPITINGGKTVTSSVKFANGVNGFGYRLTGNDSGSALYLLNPTETNSANFRVEVGSLRVADMAALGTGTITLAGAVVSAGHVDTYASLQFMGATGSSSKAITLDAAGGNIELPNGGTTLTLNGVIGEAGGTGRALTVYGGGTDSTVLTLTAANTYTGPTSATFGGVISIPTIANGGVASPLGASSNAPANLQLGGGFNNGNGTLRYTGPTASTDRGATFKNAATKATIDVNTAATTLTMSGQLIGPGGLTKAGPGTLLLTNATNSYANHTIVDGGTLAVGVNGGVLPANKNVTVNSGATFNYGNGGTIANSSAPIGTLTLNNGTFRVSGGSSDFLLNQLVIGPTGGTVDLSGTADFWTHFTGTGAGITVNADSTWTGAGTSQIRNDTGALLPITIEGNRTVTSSLKFANGNLGFGFRLNGHAYGNLFLSNPTSANTADFRVESGILRVNDMAHLGTGAITLAGSLFTAVDADTTARLYYSGATATSAKALTLDGSGAGITFASSGATLTLSGVINEIGGTGRALNVYGGDLTTPAVVALTAANTYTGPTAINEGVVVSIPTMANGGMASPLGASSAAPSNLRLGGGYFGGDGTLRYTGTTASTDRGVTMNGAFLKSIIDVNTAATTLTMSGQLVGPGGLTKAGPGKLVLTNTTNTYANGTTVDAGTLAVGSGGAVLPAGKNLTVNSGATFDYGNGLTFSNTGAAIGALTLNNGTYRVTGGSGDFYLNKLFIDSTGGSIDFSGTTAFYTHFTGTQSSITVDADTVWTGSGTSRIQNDTGALVPVTITPSATLASSVSLANGSSGFGFRLQGGGTLQLSNPTVNSTANFQVDDGTLRVSDMAALGTGTITLAGGVIISGSVDTTAQLQYAGPTASSNKPLALSVSGGSVWVSETGTTLTLGGVISEVGASRALTVYGTGNTGVSVLALTAANTYTGPTAINFGGVLSIASIANGGVASPLGASSSSPFNLRLATGVYGGDGTLRYTGPTASTDRGVTLGSAVSKSTIDVSTAGTTLTMSGQFGGLGGLTKAGPGTLSLTGTANYPGTTTVAGGTLRATGNVYDNIINFSNGLDMQSGKFIFDYGANNSPLVTVETILTEGYPTSFSFGSIRATGLAANRTLGYSDGGSAVTVMLTLPGDANLDGSVNFNDFLVLQNNFGQSNTRFDQGNFNYDGATNFNDFLVLQNNFGQSINGVTVLMTSSEVAALTAFANAAVPEPTTLALVGVGFGIIGRRRRR